MCVLNPSRTCCLIGEVLFFASLHDIDSLFSSLPRAYIRYNCKMPTLSWKLPVKVSLKTMQDEGVIDKCGHVLLALLASTCRGC